MSRLGLLVVVVGGVEPASESSVPAPLVGVDGSLDQADRNCNVVLRGLERPATGFQYETHGASWVWQGTIEVSQAATSEGLAPTMMYRTVADPTWRAATATPSQAPATPGFVGFTVRLDDHLPGTAST